MAEPHGRRSKQIVSELRTRQRLRTHGGRRTALLIAALVVAALGTTGVFFYVNGVDRRAEAGVRVDDVLVATAPIAPGTTAQAAQEAGGMELRPFLHKSLVGLAGPE